MSGLVFEQQQQAGGVENRGERGDELLAAVKRDAQDEEETEEEPVEEEKPGACEKVGERDAVLGSVGEHAGEPEKMVEVKADDAGEAELKPAFAGGDEDEAGGEQGSGDQAEQRDVADTDGDKSE